MKLCGNICIVHRVMSLVLSLCNWFCISGDLPGDGERRTEWWWQKNSRRRRARAVPSPPRLVRHTRDLNTLTRIHYMNSVCTLLMRSCATSTMRARCTRCDRAALLLLLCGEFPQRVYIYCITLYFRRYVTFILLYVLLDAVPVTYCSIVCTICIMLIYYLPALEEVSDF